MIFAFEVTSARTAAKTAGPEHGADQTEEWDDIDWRNYDVGFEDGAAGKDLSGEPDHGQPYLDGYRDGSDTKGRGFRSASLTVTAKEVGYYVCSRNGVPISGPYATRSEAAPNMIEQRGATVMFIGPGNSAEWDALKAKQFPVGSNTVNGSRRTAADVVCNQSGCHNKATKVYDTPVKGSQVGFCDEHNMPSIEDRSRTSSTHKAEKAEYTAHCGSDELHGAHMAGNGFCVGNKGERIVEKQSSWETEEDPWAGEQHTASSYGQPQPAANRAHKFVEDPRWGDESSCVRCGQPKGDVSHTDRAQATTAGSMQERYIDGQRLASLRHFADDDEVGPEEDEWFKQPKGLTDQVDTGVAPTPEIQDPNPIAGQDLERIPRNLAEAARMYATTFGWECPVCKGEGCHNCNYSGQQHATDEGRQEQYDARRGGYSAS